MTILIITLLLFVVLIYGLNKQSANQNYIVEPTLSQNDIKEILGDKVKKIYSHYLYALFVTFIVIANLLYLLSCLHFLGVDSMKFIGQNGYSMAYLYAFFPSLTICIAYVFPIVEKRLFSKDREIYLQYSFKENGSPHFLFIKIVYFVVGGLSAFSFFVYFTAFFYYDKDKAVFHEAYDFLPTEIKWGNLEKVEYGTLKNPKNPFYYNLVFKNGKEWSSSNYQRKNMPQVKSLIDFLVNERGVSMDTIGFRVRKQKFNN